MAKNKHKRTQKTVLKLPDLEQSKSAVINSLTSASSKRSCDSRIHRVVLLRASTCLQQDGSSRDTGLPSNSTHLLRRRSI